MTRRRARRGAVVLAFAVAAGACGSGSTADDRASAGAGSGPASDVGTGGSTLALATSIPGTLRTPLSVPTTVPGVSVTIPDTRPCTIKATIDNTKLGFAYDSSAVSADGEALVRTFVAEVKHNTLPLQRVDLAGFASSEGPDDYNRVLSQSRADAVAAVLAGITALDGVPVTAVGRGEGDPIADNATEEGRSANRRVEISFHFSGCT